MFRSSSDFCFRHMGRGRGLKRWAASLALPFATCREEYLLLVEKDATDQSVTVEWNVSQEAVCSSWCHSVLSHITLSPRAVLFQCETKGFPCNESLWGPRASFSWSTTWCQLP